MRYILAIATVLTLATVANAADKVLIPAYKGMIQNNTSIPNESLKIIVHVECKYKKGLFWPESYSCGKSMNAITVHADGSFSVPEVKYMDKKSIRYYRAIISIYAVEAHLGSHTYYDKEILQMPKQNIYVLD